MPPPLVDVVIYGFRRYGEFECCREEGSDLLGTEGEFHLFADESNLRLAEFGSPSVSSTPFGCRVVLSLVA